MLKTKYTEDANYVNACMSADTSIMGVVPGSTNFYMGGPTHLIVDMSDDATYLDKVSA